MKPKWSAAYYGASLAAFKIKKYGQALQLIEKAISNLDESLQRECDQQQSNAQIYLKAMCHKKLRQYP